MPRPVLPIVFALSFICAALASRRCDAEGNKGGRSTSRQVVRTGLTVAQHAIPLAVKMSWPARLVLGVGFQFITPASDKPEPSYVHGEVPGRLRVRMSSLAGRSEEMAGVKRLLEAQRGVRSVEPTLRTGSVLIWHDPRVVSSARLLDTLATTRHFDPKHTTGLGAELTKTAFNVLGLLL